MLTDTWGRMNAFAKTAMVAGAAAAVVATGAAVGQPASGPGSVVSTTSPAQPQGSLPDFCYPSKGDPIDYGVTAPRARLVSATLTDDDPCNPSQTLISGGVNCDCPHVDFGILTKEFQDACFQRQTALRKLALAHQLGLKADQTHHLVSGEFCGEEGPNAWPDSGDPEVAPPAAPGSDAPPCQHVDGISRKCLDAYVLGPVVPDSS